MNKATLHGLMLATVIMLTTSSTDAASAPTDDIGVIGGSVSRAAFTTAVVNREPTDRLQELSNDHRLVYFFSELKGMMGQKVTLQWEYGGKIIAKAMMTVGGYKWKAISSLPLDPNRLGVWTVAVVNDLGQVMNRYSFNYIAATARRATAALK